MPRAPLLALLILGLAPAASALDLGYGLAVSGEVKLEYVDATDGELATSADIGLAWRSGGLLGFDVAIDSLARLETDEDFTNIWAALVLSTAAGELAVGAPRPVLETLQVMPRFSASRLVDLQTTSFRGPLATLVSYDAGGLVPGIAFIGETGTLGYGLSYHHIDDAGSVVNVIEGAMTYRRGATTLFVTGEYAETPGDDVSQLQIGGYHQTERYAVGLALGQTDLSGDGRLTGRLHASYTIVPAFTVTGDMIAIESADDVYSVSGQYRLGSRAFIEGGASRIGTTDVYDIGIGLKF